MGFADNTLCPSPCFWAVSFGCIADLNAAFAGLEAMSSTLDVPVTRPRASRDARAAPKASNKAKKHSFIQPVAGCVQTLREVAPVSACQGRIHGLTRA